MTLNETTVLIEYQNTLPDDVVVVLRGVATGVHGGARVYERVPSALGAFERIERPLVTMSIDANPLLLPDPDNDFEFAKLVAEIVRCVRKYHAVARGALVGEELNSRYRTPMLSVRVAFESGVVAELEFDPDLDEAEVNHYADKVMTLFTGGSEAAPLLATLLGKGRSTTRRTHVRYRLKKGLVNIEDNWRWTMSPQLVAQKEAP